jgi:hypothetical protein
MTIAEEIEQRQLYPHFEALKINPAYLFIKELFMDQMLRPEGSSMQEKAEKHIAEVAIMSVFRQIEVCSNALESPIDLTANQALEEEDYIDEHEPSPLD